MKLQYPQGISKPGSFSRKRCDGRIELYKRCIPSAESSRQSSRTPCLGLHPLGLLRRRADPLYAATHSSTCRTLVWSIELCVSRLLLLLEYTIQERAKDDPDHSLALPSGRDILYSRHTRQQKPLGTHETFKLLCP